MNSTLPNGCTRCRCGAVIDDPDFGPDDECLDCKIDRAERAQDDAIWRAGCG
jgi:hypothetical protein